jgi:thiosulfate/3-mercaptopyruvate sulfurtransferase
MSDAAAAIEEAVCTPLPRQVARWQHLVTPEWLAAWLAGGAVAAAPAGQCLLVEVGFEAQSQFEAAHIPGAAYLDTTSLEHGPYWNKVPDAQLLQVLLHAGIRHDTTVLVYGRSPLAAARAAHLMLYAGVRDVRLLDGGFAAWQAEGRAVEAGASRSPMPAYDFGAPFPSRPDYLLDLHQARQLLAQGEGQLVSIRSWSEHTGRESGYSYIAAKGDIPGARWGRAGRDGDVQCMADFHERDGTMKSPAQIQAQWRSQGIAPGRPTAFYCGTGWRASLAFFYAWLMEWDGIAVFDGGWCEWSAPGATQAGPAPRLQSQPAGR